MRHDRKPPPERTLAERFPLGVPVNRPVTNDTLRPVPGRPGWWVDAHGVERYIEPNPPPPAVPPVPPVPTRRETND